MSHARVHALSLVFALSCAGCSDRVIDSRAYNEEGRIAWSTVMPSSRNTALWLRYSVNGPVTRASTEDEGALYYDFSGNLRVLVDGGPHYAGSVFLKPEGVVVDRVYSKGVRDGVTRSCGYSSCAESGRIKLMMLQEVPAGARLEIEGSLPLAGQGAELLSANLELAPN